MSAVNTRPGAEAVRVKGWLAAHKWLLARRAAQVSFLALFLVGPLSALVLGKDKAWWIVKGNLASSLTLDILPLTDPLLLIQSFLAGHWVETTALIGAAIVLGAYLLVGGRAYCSWVCPVNVVTDAANWLRQRLGLKGGVQIQRRTRLWVLGMVLVVSAVTGTIAWEVVNPITMLQRGLVFGVGAAWMVVLAVFLFDLFVSRRGWCSHLCPVGAFYGLLGTVGVVRVSASRREACNNCGDCYVVCPEPQVIAPALKGADRQLGPVILSGDCTNCGRCIDVCAPDVFDFGTRFNNKPADAPAVREAA